MYTIYGRENCKFCDLAKELLEELGHEYEYNDVMKDTQQQAILLEKIPDVRTVPQIFLGDRHIGGYTELKQELIDNT